MDPTEFIQRLSSFSEEWTLVALAGLPGSGKSTLARAVADLIPHAVVIPMDGYHLPRAVLSAGDLARRGAPHTFDAAALHRDLTQLRRDRCGMFPDFDHATQDPQPGAIEVTSEHRWILVEGLYLLLKSWQLEPLFDHAFFLDTPLDLAMERTAQRHVSCGLCDSLEKAHTRVETNDRPNAELILRDGCRDRAERLE